MKRDLAMRKRTHNPARTRTHRIPPFIKLTVLILLLSHARAYALDIVVSNVSQLINAINSIGPGQRILLAPGTYVLSDRLRFPASRSGTSTSPVTIKSRDGLGTVKIDANGQEEAFHFTGAKFVIIEGLRITGGAYHAIKIDAPSTDITIRNNALFDNTRTSNLSSQVSAIKGGGAGPVNGTYASRVTIENNEIYQVNAFGGKNFQGIDCNGCKSWVVRGNFIHDIRGASLAGTCIQFKSGSADTLIENNKVRNCGLVGINYGGFGTPSWGGETYEHVRGIVRNNTISGCKDAGISVIKNKDGKIYNNTLYNNGYNPDVRVSAYNVRYRNNILDRPLKLRDGTTVTQSNNLVLSSPTDGSLFVNAGGNDFHLKSTASGAINKGYNLGSDVPTDFERDTRPQSTAFDIGADEFRATASTSASTAKAVSSFSQDLTSAPASIVWGIREDIPVPGDYDGDGRVDTAVWRPLEGNWYLLPSLNPPSLQPWGTSEDKPVPGDYNGDGQMDLAVWQPSQGIWSIRNSSGGTTMEKLGEPLDIPVPGDYDGDGKMDIAIFSPSSGEWSVNPSSGGALRGQPWGQNGDRPVPGDYDGDGRTDLAIWRPEEGNWYILFSSGGYQVTTWGQDGDVPASGDYDGDGMTDLAVWRPAEGNWYILFSSRGSAVISLGEMGDTPAPADYDGDGRTDLAVWRPSEGIWYVK